MAARGENLVPAIFFNFLSFFPSILQVRILPYVAGTWMGTLPAISAFVSVGKCVGVGVGGWVGGCASIYVGKYYIYIYLAAISALV